MKNQKQTHWAVLKQERQGSRHGGMITTITLVGVQDRKEYTTYVDPTNFNAKLWQHIVRHNEHGFILKGLKVKDAVKRIINADSDPIIEWEHQDVDTVARELKDFWDEQDCPNKFNNLFD